MIRTLSLLGLSCALAVVSTHALAQPKDASTVKQLFIDGKAALDAGDFPTACGKFEQAVTLDPTAIGALAALADCDEKWGHTASAYNAYVRLEGETAKDSSKKDALEYARKKITELEPKLAKLTIDVPQAFGPSIEGLEIERDGAPVNAGLRGVAVPIDAGDHQVVVRAKGRDDWKHGWSQKDGEALTVTIELGVERKEAAPETPATGSFWSAPRVAGLVVGLVGLAGIGASLGVGAIAINSNNDSNAHGCSALTNVCPPGQATDQRQTALDLSHVSTAVFVVGVAATGAGVLLFALAPRGKAKEPAAAVGIGLGAMTLHGAF